MHPFLNCPAHASWPKINAVSAFPVFELKVTAPNHAKNNHARFGVFPLKKNQSPFARIWKQRRICAFVIFIRTRNAVAVQFVQA